MCYSFARESLAVSGPTGCDCAESVDTEAVHEVRPAHIRHAYLEELGESMVWQRNRCRALLRIADVE